MASVEKSMNVATVLSHDCDLSDWYPTSAKGCFPSTLNFDAINQHSKPRFHYHSRRRRYIVLIFFDRLLDSAQKLFRSFGGRKRLRIGALVQLGGSVGWASRSAHRLIGRGLFARIDRGALRNEITLHRQSLLIITQLARMLHHQR